MRDGQREFLHRAVAALRHRLGKAVARAHTYEIFVLTFDDARHAARNVPVGNGRRSVHAVDLPAGQFAETIGENALLASIEELNENPHVNGIIVQLPLPKQINPLKVLSCINPKKDVDGFSPYNIGLLASKEDGAVVAATPKGILRLLKSTGVDLCGKHAVVIGRSNIVGRPVSLLLLNNDCTVTITHSKTVGLAEIVRQADIVVAACGCPKMVKKDWVKPEAIIIDVGINRLEDGKLCGDVDFEEVKEVASYITPVPGGVGPMTVAMLLENTLEAAQRQKNSNEHHHCHCGKCNHS